MLHAMAAVVGDLAPGEFSSRYIRSTADELAALSPASVQYATSALGALNTAASAAHASSPHDAEVALARERVEIAFARVLPRCRSTDSSIASRWSCAR
jgi:hypothetical protein